MLGYSEASTTTNKKKHYSRNYTAIINNGFFQLQSENQSRWGKRKNRNNSQALLKIYTLNTKTLPVIGNLWRGCVCYVVVYVILMTQETFTFKIIIIMPQGSWKTVHFLLI